MFCDNTWKTSFDKPKKRGHFTDRVLPLFRCHVFRKIRGSNSSTFLEVGGWILTAPVSPKQDRFFLFEKKRGCKGCGLVWYRFVEMRNLYINNIFVALPGFKWSPFINLSSVMFQGGMVANTLQAQSKNTPWIAKKGLDFRANCIHDNLDSIK